MRRISTICYVLLFIWMSLDFMMYVSGEKEICIYSVIAFLISFAFYILNRKNYKNV